MRNQSKLSIIYKITNKENNKCYIGQTIRKIEIRWKQHIRDSKKFDHAFARALRKYPIETWDITTLEIIDDELLNEREIFWIDHFKSHKKEFGYNGTLGGHDCVRPNEETRQKMKNNHKGMLGKNCSEEHKRNIGLGNIGKKHPHSQETKDKIGSYWKGRKRKEFSEEHKEKIRNSQKGRLVSDEMRKIRSENAKKQWAEGRFKKNHY